VKIASVIKNATQLILKNQQTKLSNSLVLCPWVMGWVNFHPTVTQQAPAVLACLKWIRFGLSPSDLSLVAVLACRFGSRPVVISCSYSHLLQATYVA